MHACSFRCSVTAASTSGKEHLIIKSGAASQYPTGFTFPTEVISRDIGTLGLHRSSDFAVRNASESDIENLSEYICGAFLRIRKGRAPW